MTTPSLPVPSRSAESDPAAPNPTTLLRQAAQILYSCEIRRQSYSRAESDGSGWMDTPGARAVEFEYLGDRLRRAHELVAAAHAALTEAAAATAAATPTDVSTT